MSDNYINNPDYRNIYSNAEETLNLEDLTNVILAQKNLSGISSINKADFDVRWLIYWY